MTEKEKQLNQQIEAGNKAAFKRVFDIELAPMYAQLWAYHHDISQVETTITEVFTDAWKEATQHGIKSSVKKLLWKKLEEKCKCTTHKKHEDGWFIPEVDLRYLEALAELPFKDQINFLIAHHEEGKNEVNHSEKIASTANTLAHLHKKLDRHLPYIREKVMWDFIWSEDEDDNVQEL